MDGGQRLQTTRRWCHGGGSPCSRARDDRVGNTAWVMHGHGSFWSATGAGSLTKRLQLPSSAARAFDKRLPQSISAVSQLFLANLVARNGPVHLLGGSWECQSVSRAGRQLGAMDPCQAVQDR